MEQCTICGNQIKELRAPSVGICQSCLDDADHAAAAELAADQILERQELEDFAGDNDWRQWDEDYSDD